MSTYQPTEPLVAVSDEPRERWAIGDFSSHARLWGCAVVGLVADLWTKDWAFREIGPHETRTLIPNLASLQLSLNPGALFGLGAGLAPIFVGASALALMFVLYLFAHSTRSRRSMHIALGLVLAGAIGNLYDRTTQNAYVASYSNRGRIIGTLLEEDPNGRIKIGDFPTGANAQWMDRPSDPRSGPQPVVRDFIKIEARIGDFSLWPWIFNIADALLVVGVAMLLLNFWFDHKHHPREEPTAP
ncbi:MAG TPA: signal peptidase II [Phycisphaerae bacterium]|nr:signal peptidase II [Phycisphaerae bacterium]